MDTSLVFHCTIVGIDFKENYKFGINSLKPDWKIDLEQQYPSFNESLFVNNVNFINETFL